MANFNKDVIFEVKCTNTNFATYLRDMRFLRVETVDCRNGSVIGVCLVNLAMLVNPVPLDSEDDCPFLPMREIFEVIRPNLQKTKIGEMEISIECEFHLQRGNRGGDSYRSPLHVFDKESFAVHSPRSNNPPSHNFSNHEHSINNERQQLQGGIPNEAALYEVSHQPRLEKFPSGNKN